VALVGAILLAVFVVPGGLDYAVVGAGAAIEIGEATFWWRWTHRRRPEVGAEALVGKVGRVVDECTPEGRVRVQGELWSARCPGGAEQGAAVRVLALEGLTLLVERT
jgi:membrane protein implicated in regulation of membrane protease activity